MAAALASKAQFGNYNPASIGWGGANDPEAHPSLLKPFSFNGVTFGPMHVAVHGLFTALLSELVPKIQGGLVAGTCGCYNPKSVTVGGDRSFHTYAIAIDVNWNANPMYAKSHPTGPHTLPNATSAIAKSFGCEWGGDWTYPQDWMHIECHLSPAVARSVKAGTIGTTEDEMSAAEVKEIIKAVNAGTTKLQKVIQNQSTYLNNAQRAINQNITKQANGVVAAIKGELPTGKADGTYTLAEIESASEAAVRKVFADAATKEDK